jgi:MOSC domain-containing protein YiiM
VAEGIVLALQIAPHKGEPMRWVDEVYAVPKKGLKGDRYFASPQGKRVSAVTLIESEALEALEKESGIHLSFEDTRRNVLTRGLFLNTLVGQDFRLGNVVLRGTELCEPCWHIAQSNPGVLRGLLHRGGLRAQILTEGTILVYSPVLSSATSKFRRSEG